MKRTLAAVLSLLMALSLLLSGCSPASKAPTYAEWAVEDPSLTGSVPATDNNRVFYEIFVGSFSDSNGDGIGDLQGIIQRLDYLNDGDPDSGRSLGVEGLWLTPIFESPSYHKYDVKDYYQIDPDFGTEEDLVTLLEMCHERNMLVILDLPINHTSVTCSWYSQFRSAHLKGLTDDPYYDFYCWYPAEETPAGRTFMPVSGTDHMVECNFSTEMPEPCFDQEFVRTTMLDVAAYYLDLGVDGFRFDAAKYIYFDDHEQSVDFWVWYIDALKKIKPDIYTVAEVWDGDGITDLYYEALNCFDFTASQVSGIIAETAQKGNVNRFTAYVDDYLETVQGIREDAAILLFIANHDMDRAAGYLTDASGQIRMAANLYLLGPGSPFIYYGEEIGLRGSRGGAQTDANRRLAMKWGDDDPVSDPEGTTYDPAKQVEMGALEQMQDENSLYSYYKKLIMIRKANPEIARGDYTALEFQDTKLGGFTSTYEGSTVCVLHNTTLSSITVDLSTVTNLTFTELAAVIGVVSYEGEETTLEGTLLTLAPQTSCVLR
ncbi:MAG: hypothetical protein HUJ69_08635 [Lachnospiraceae bacterium]|nr:hypothetical protein [Lachnospiraceae bacterium]